ncbi:phenylacetic acid degradation protein [Adhaeribacter aerolatus]|uniref:Phenylacetic acid degradation protein n=1 Tax=Adhaeribacter aerolatus TaxID=670289 RepID=A0A512AU76_9BACT|nr:ferredoxin--NADP reductase [Adhaeribacter aerolatus]GEO03269.1 phenylacetic acid degradation protein [Adhaeribacter aerolatus]
MSSAYHQLKVVQVTRETPDAVTIFFEHPEREIIPSKAGQFLTLILPFKGKKERRSYSLSSAPYEAPRLAVTVKRVPGGLVSNYLVDKCTEGTVIEVMAPMGNFSVSTDPTQVRNLVLIGAGSGITPLISIAKTVLHGEPKSRVNLIYGNRHEGTIIFREQLAELEETYADRLVVEHVLSQPKYTPDSPANVNGPAQPAKLSFKDRLKSLFGQPVPSPAENQNIKPIEGLKYTGRLNQKMLLDILRDNNLTDYLDTEFYLCGPEGLMDEAREALKILKVGPDRIHKENFVVTHTDPLPDSGTVSTIADSAATPDCPIVTLIYEGTEYKVPVPKDQTILEAGLAQDIDLPYSCQAGLCTACRGKCLSGKVHLDEREGLSDAEMEEGYVLNCVGHPLTDDVVIEIG